MAQVVPGAPTIGQGLGRGLSAGLSQLAEQKFAELSRRQEHREKATRLHKLGLPYDEANYLAGLSDKYSLAGVNNYFNSGQAAGEPTPQGQPQQQQMQQPQQQEQPQGALEQLSNASQSVPGASKSPEQLMLESLASGKPLTPIQALMQSLQQGSETSQQSNQPQPIQPDGSQQPNQIPQQMGNEGGAQDVFSGHEMPPDLQEFISQQTGKQGSPPQKKRSAFGNALGASTSIVKPQQQASIDRANAPFVKDLDKRANAAKELVEIADRMESLVSSGKVSKGPWGAIQQRLGKIIPQSPETEQFDSDASAAAILKASLIPGTVTNERLKASERTKPSINQTPESQLARIRVMRNEALSVLAEDAARSQIIEENGGNQPPNMRQIVEKRAKEIKREFRQAEKVADLSVGSVVDSSKSSHVPEGTTGTDEKGNPVLFKKGKWVRA